MEYLDSIEVHIYDLKICSLCTKYIMAGEEICETINDTGGIYRIDHFFCAFPRGGL